MFLIPARLILGGRFSYFFYLLLEKLEGAKTNKHYFKHQPFYNPV